MRTPHVLLCLSLLAAPLLVTPLRQAHAEGHSVTVVNSSRETIRRIEIGTSDNRLRSSLPPGAQAAITYSTGCQADVRLAYDTGRTETFTAVDVCSNPRIASGQGVVGTGPVPSEATASPPASSKPGKPGAPLLATPAKAPPPVVPPWTGKSITKRFGGME